MPDSSRLLSVPNVGGPNPASATFEPIRGLGMSRGRLPIPNPTITIHDSRMSSKSEILRKIEDLFYAKSFSDLSMDEIALALEMKKASLYYHYPSKEAMFTEILYESYE